MSLPRHIRKGVLIRRIIASDLFTADAASDFAKNRKSAKGELCLNVIIPFFHHCIFLSLREVPKTVF